MKIKCLHGYFIFEEVKVGQISEFMSLTGLELVPVDNYFTFSFLSDAPQYSILLSPYLGIPAIKTFEGKPWEVMRENKLVYNFNLGLVVPLLSVVNLISVQAAQHYYMSDGLIMPGSLTDRGKRVTDYSAWFSIDSMRYKYTEITYADA